MGFTSATDFRTNDIIRPSTSSASRSRTARTTTTRHHRRVPDHSRTVDFNNPTNDDVNSDIISEYRMSDGSPWQASHFREQGNCSLTTNIIMDPLSAAAAPSSAAITTATATSTCSTPSGTTWSTATRPSSPSSPRTPPRARSDRAAHRRSDGSLPPPVVRVFLLPVSGTSAGIPNVQESDGGSASAVSRTRSAPSTRASR